MDIANVAAIGVSKQSPIVFIWSIDGQIRDAVAQAIKAACKLSGISAAAEITKRCKAFSTILITRVFGINVRPQHIVFCKTAIDAL